MAEASKVSGEKYRRIFSEYDPVFVDTVSSAVLSCNLNFSEYDPDLDPVFVDAVSSAALSCISQ